MFSIDENKKITKGYRKKKKKNFNTNFKIELSENRYEIEYFVVQLFFLFSKIPKTRSKIERIFLPSDE